MNILVCVKRVPLTGGKISLTEDEQAIQTRHLGFTVSPHEECGAEEAIRLVEAHGGESVALTLGPAEAEEQLRDLMAIGIDRGIHLVTDGSESDPQATAAAIVAAVRAEPEPFDLILFGTESADAGNYQVAIRVAYALGLPVVNGIKGITVDAASVRCEREVSGGRDVYEVAMPAVVTVMEGINLPRYPSVPGRMRAKRKPIAASEPAKSEAKLKMVRLVLPEASTKQVEMLGSGAGRGPQGRRDPARDRSPLMTTLVFVESADDELSQQAAVMAASLGGDVAAVAIDGGGLGFAPAAWAQTLVDHAVATGATAVVAPGTDRGNEVLAHVAAKLDQPMAANCTKIAAGSPASVTRVRWGGSCWRRHSWTARRCC